jgi:hypothetical protein
MPVLTIALWIVLGCGKAACAPAPEVSDTFKFTYSAEPKKTTTETVSVPETAEGSIEKVTFQPKTVDVIDPGASLHSESIEFDRITATITDGPELSGLNEEMQHLFTVHLNSDEGIDRKLSDKLTFTADTKPTFSKGIEILELGTDTNIEHGFLDIPEQHFVVGPETVDLSKFRITFKDNPVGGGISDMGENLDVLSVSFSSVPEPGTLLLIGVVLLAVALRAAQWKFRRVTSPI